MNTAAAADGGWLVVMVIESGSGAVRARVWRAAIRRSQSSSVT